MSGASLGCVLNLNLRPIVSSLGGVVCCRRRAQLKKIDELLSSFYYLNWVPAEVSLQPDPCMWDLITYLRVTFAHLAQLPMVVREAIHFASCIHISKALEQLLCGATVRRLNVAGIANFKRNLDAMIDYVGSIEIQQLKECFLALTQLLELLLSGHADKFLDPHQRYASVAEPTVHSRVRSSFLVARVPTTDNVWDCAVQRDRQVLAPVGRQRRERARQDEGHQVIVSALGLELAHWHQHTEEVWTARLGGQVTAKVRQHASS